MLFQTLLTAFLALGLTAPPVTRTVVVAQRLRSVSVTHLHLPMGDSTALETGYKWSVAMITLVHVRFFLQNMSVFLKHTLPIAEWSTWSSWGPCSQTCDYGIKQQTRTCSVSGACGGLGLNTLTEYCELGSCLGKSLGKLVAQKLHHQQIIYPLSLKRYFYDTLCGDPDSQRWIPCQCNNSDYYRCSSIKDSGMIHQAIT